MMPPMRSFPLLSPLLAGAVLVAGSAPRAGLAQGAAPGRVVAIGDIHGAGDALVRILQKAGLIDGDRHWSGGTATLVQTGDYLDRGPAVRPVLDLLMQLETEARAAGGRAEILLGNHEVMNMLGAMSDVSPEAFASFADDDSRERLTKAFDAQQAAARRSGAAGPGARAAWFTAHP